MLFICNVWVQWYDPLSTRQALTWHVYRNYRPSIHLLTEIRAIPSPLMTLPPLNGPMVHRRVLCALHPTP